MSAAEGVNVAIAPDTAIVAVTFDDAPAAFSVKVEVVKLTDAVRNRLRKAQVRQSR